MHAGIQAENVAHDSERGACAGKYGGAGRVDLLLERDASARDCAVFGFSVCDELPQTTSINEEGVAEFDSNSSSVARQYTSHSRAVHRSAV